MLRRQPEPFLWLLFSSGGVVAALLLPSLIFLLGLAFPLGWVSPPTYARLAAVIANPLTKLVLFGLCVLSLFHAAHRFRYTLYDGLQIKHLNEFIAIVCYGGAVAGSLAAAYLLITFG